MTDTHPVGSPDHDLAWIQQQLQTAMELECSTLPLYLSAMFSLKEQTGAAYDAIRPVVMEEMVHMGTAANMLAALGQAPQIKTLNCKFPTRGLAGGTEPDLLVGLAKLSMPQLKNFMRIEMPMFLLRHTYSDEAYPTIASFYSGIRQAILDNGNAVRDAIRRGGPSNQVSDNIGIVPITYVEGTDPLDKFMIAIDKILEQGEGSSAGSLFTGEGSRDEASHYLRFAEIYYEAIYSDPRPALELTPETEPDFFKGRKILRPEVVNTLAVPSDGYAKILELDPNALPVKADLETFDAAYTSILEVLDQVWNGPPSESWKTLGGSIPTMMRMRVLSCYNIMMRHQIPDDVVAQIPTLYQQEIAHLRAYSDFKAPLFYGPRFLNTNCTL